MSDLALNYTASADPQSISNPHQKPLSRPSLTKTLIPYAVLTDPRLSDGAKLTYAVLRGFANGDTACSPSKRELCRIRGVSDRTLVRQVRQLEAGRHITVEYRDGERPVYTCHAEKGTPSIRLVPPADLRGVPPADLRGGDGSFAGGSAVVHKRNCSSSSSNSVQSSSILARLRLLAGPTYGHSLHARIVAKCTALDPQFDPADLARLIPLAMRPDMRSLGLLLDTVPDLVALEREGTPAAVSPARPIAQLGSCGRCVDGLIGLTKPAAQVRSLADELARGVTVCGCDLGAMWGQS